MTNDKSMTKSKVLKIVLLFLFISFLILPEMKGLAQEDLDEACLDLAEKGCQNLGADACRKELEKCEEYYQKESARIEEDLSKTEKEKKTLENKVSSLKKKIQNLSYQINQSNLIIKDLGIQIEDTQESIKETSSEIGESTENLVNILRNIYEEDEKTTIEILLSENDLSDFFDNLVSLEMLDSRSKDLLKDIKILKSNLEEQEVSLDEEQQELRQIVEVQTIQKKESAKTKEEQEYYLGLTEKEYQKYVQEQKETQRKASEIRARIFDLIGVPKAPTFGEAYEMARYVEGLTGVRPAFLLAVLTQESSIGKNVGQCYLPSDPKENIRRKIMAPGPPTTKRNDVSNFLQITGELGRDPYATPVSCPMSYGWGGAMGPAQFIPTTWMIYRDRLRGITGRPADPWNIQDAFLAAAVYLSDYGAAKQTYNGEFNAALSYFAGPSWYKSSYKNIYKRDYGYPVMRITDGYEADIKSLQ